MCAERNWSTRGILPESSPELEALLEQATTPEQVREICLAYAAARGTVVMTPDGVHAHATGKVDESAHEYSAVVVVNGRRQLLVGCRSQAELDATVKELEAREAQRQR
jgi:hypothetical protein